MSDSKSRRRREARAVDTSALNLRARGAARVRRPK
jgi:hypothetical protein